MTRPCWEKSFRCSENKITSEKDAVRYKVIVENMLNPMVRGMAGEETTDLSALNLTEAAVHFLTGAGMSEEQVQALKAKISKD